MIKGSRAQLKKEVDNFLLKLELQERINEASKESIKSHMEKLSQN